MNCDDTRPPDDVNPREAGEPSRPEAAERSAWVITNTVAAGVTSVYLATGSLAATGIAACLSALLILGPRRAPARRRR